MLLRLSIRDFVLVDRLELEFAAGFGALTGETGAGKSILVDALAFILGERADAGLIRSGCERAEVSAEFATTGLPAVCDWLRENEMEAGEDGALILRRTLDAGGRSRVWINGSASTCSSCVRWPRAWSTSTVSTRINHCCAATYSARCLTTMPASHPQSPGGGRLARLASRKRFARGRRRRC